jgi:hypothetical protein
MHMRRPHVHSNAPSLVHDPCMSQVAKQQTLKCQDVKIDHDDDNNEDLLPFLRLVTVDVVIIRTSLIFSGANCLPKMFHEREMFSCDSLTDIKPASDSCDGSDTCDTLLSTNYTTVVANEPIKDRR